MNKRSLKGIFFVVTVLSFVMGILPGKAASFPTKAVTLIVPWVAGGSTDTCMRVLVENTAKHLGQPVIVENKPGGAGTV